MSWSPTNEENHRANEEHDEETDIFAVAVQPPESKICVLAGACINSEVQSTIFGLKQTATYCALAALHIIKKAKVY